MPRDDWDHMDLEERQERSKVLRAMTPMEKFREVDRLWAEAREAGRAYRASLFALPTADRKVGRLLRIAPDDPRR